MTRKSKASRSLRRGGVFSPDILKGRKDVLVLICSWQAKFIKEITAQLQNLGLTFLDLNEYIFAKRSAEILRCLELLEDEKSAQIYTEIIECWLLRIPNPAKEFISGEQYFALPEFVEVPIIEKEVFVDCGAFVGDTVEKYIWSHGGLFEKIFAFEPDIVNYRALEKRIEHLNSVWALPEGKIQAINAGVGRKTTSGIIQAHERMSSRISENTDLTGDSIKIYAIDNYFSSQKIGFLKADIESFEFDMLRGAEKVIRRDLPKMAICIYHYVSDLYQILNWIADLNLGYKFSIRHHYTRETETVLYVYH